jgi:hypothetical protein
MATNPATGIGENKMSENPLDYLAPPDVVAAARDLIWNYGEGRIVSVSQLLDNLSERFGDRFNVSPDVYKVLDLMATLQDEPQIDQSQSGWIEYVWNEQGGGQVPDLGSAKLPRHVQERTSDSRRANRFVAALKCSLLVRRRSSDGVIFPEFADFVSSIFCINPFGEEMMLVDVERPNTVCWNNRCNQEGDSRTSQNTDGAYNRPAVLRRRGTVKMLHDSHDDDYVLMPVVEGEIAEGGYETPHWVPTMFVWDDEQHRTVQ